MSNVFSNPILPVGTQNPGASVATSLAKPPGEAPSTIPNNAPLQTNGMRKFIVVFKKGSPQSEIDAAEKRVESDGGKVTQRYKSSILGFAAEVPDSLVNTLEGNEHVEYVEPDTEVRAY
ncbi:hypothetical protein BGZ46_007419 [Entomortierella lignicola]|nr:hypothetical protein BGZ46_007419 [Entomortierella lignicola]